MKLAYLYVDLLNAVRNDPVMSGGANKQCSQRWKSTKDLCIIFLRQVSIPFVQMIVLCHAELLICATVLQHHLSIAIVFLCFQIQDNEYDFRRTAPY